MPPLYNFGANRIQITTSNSSSVSLCLSVAAETCLASRCLAMDVSAVLLSLHTSGVQVSCHSIYIYIYICISRRINLLSVVTSGSGVVSLLCDEMIM
jgi:hypothetical protein